MGDRILIAELSELRHRVNKFEALEKEKRRLKEALKKAHVELELHIKVLS